MKSKITLLKKAELKKLTKLLPQWQVNVKQTELQRTFSFSSHIDALVFIARITVHAQVLNHHPDLHFTYKKVKVKLTTHDCKGLTNVDVEFAKRTDSLNSG